jgi:Yip1-like protein
MMLLGPRRTLGEQMDIVARAKNILLSPNTEWPVIAAEPTTADKLYTAYIMPLSAIPPVCGLIGLSLFLGRLGFGFGLLGALLSWVFGLVGIYIVALVAQWLAPKFGGSGDLLASLKLVAYSHTAAWVGGIFMLIPFLGLLSFLMSLYGLYLLYTGATPVVGVPQDRAVTYMITLVVCVIVVFLLISFIVRVLFGLSMLGMV